MPAERASPPTSDFADCVPADSHMDSESPGAAAVDTNPPLLELREPPASARPGRSSSPRRQTHAEKARETKLRNDPYAVVHNARLVQCNRCLTFIKLSLKSNWDPAHWQKHRERCIRRSGAHVNELREANKKTLPSPDPTESKTRGPSTSRTSSPLTPPPLTPDLDNLGDDHSSIGASAAVDEPPLSSSEFDAEPSSPTPSSPARSPSPSPHATTILRKPDPSFDEYLVRSRRRAMHELSPQVLDSWQDWSWAQLKEPVWVTEGRPGVTREDAVVATYLLALKGERTGHRAPVSVASSVSTNYDSD
ncbi:hypothetical protein WOLCODRAFT_28480 [Wolfiporia cocos MD-104 SS10]|uniref:Uncharacterized protein n=1 Tax=Wolfiporia cocos (strain MD-104) TaxID=742152 RepID=A0A2H3JI25_WOLCO|nr:hypothetical protein WOLCODRAFT_28480 [Wolfiporia cocos MD-104 SS10]